MVELMKSFQAPGFDVSSEDLLVVVTVEKGACSASHVSFASVPVKLALLTLRILRHL